MFTNLLYDHKFDIDDIINALCGTNHQGRWLLNTQEGTLVREDETTNTANIKDGDNNNHWHVITPLGSDFISHVLKQNMADRLSAQDIAALTQFVTPQTPLHTLPSFFNEGEAGGWLRERLKEQAVHWLGERNLIPPSMCHVSNLSSPMAGQS